MKYKLINIHTKEETLCDKVTIDGFDYYVSDNYINKLKPDDAYHTIVENPRRVVRYTKHIQDTSSVVIICTNNPNLDIPKIVPTMEDWDEIYDDYVGESDLHAFVQWLKDNFQVPNKL